MLARPQRRLTLLALFATACWANFAVASAAEPLSTTARQQAAETSTTEMAPANVQLEEIPNPNLDALEPEVAVQLQRARALWKAQGDAPRERQVQVLLSLARLYHAYELWESALACYQRLVRLSPNAFEAHYLLAHASQLAGHNEQAEQAYRSALALRPDDLASALHLADVLVLMNRRDESIELVDGVLSKQPDLSAARLMRGELALAERDYPAAIALLERVIQEVPRANRGHYLLAQALRAEGKMNQARQHLAQSGSIGVRIPDPLIEEINQLIIGERVAIMEGKLAYEAGDFRHAAERFQAALLVAPASNTAEVNLSASLVKLGEVDRAIAHLNRVLKRAPDNLTAHFNLAELQLSRGDAGRARAHYSAVLEQRPDDVQALLGMARSAAALGDAEATLNSYRQVVQRVPEQAGAWLELIDWLLQTQRRAEAGETLVQATELHPSDGQLAHRYAEFLLESPNQNEQGYALALDLAQRVFAARPDPIHANTLARALAASGDCEGAAELQAQLLDHLRRSGDSDGLAQAEQRLIRYRAGPACFEPPKP